MRRTFLSRARSLSTLACVRIGLTIPTIFWESFELPLDVGMTDQPLRTPFSASLRGGITHWPPQATSVALALLVSSQVGGEGPRRRKVNAPTAHPMPLSAGRCSRRHQNRSLCRVLAPSCRLHLATPNPQTKKPTWASYGELWTTGPIPHLYRRHKWCGNATNGVAMPQTMWRFIGGHAAGVMKGGYGQMVCLGGRSRVRVGRSRGASLLLALGNRRRGLPC